MRTEDICWAILRPPFRGVTRSASASDPCLAGPKTSTAAGDDEERPRMTKRQDAKRVQQEDAAETHEPQACADAVGRFACPEFARADDDEDDRPQLAQVPARQPRSSCCPKEHQPEPDEHAAPKVTCDACLRRPSHAMPRTTRSACASATGRVRTIRTGAPPPHPPPPRPPPPRRATFSMSRRAPSFLTRIRSRRRRLRLPASSGRSRSVTRRAGKAFRSGHRDRPDALGNACILTYNRTRGSHGVLLA